LPDRRWWGTGVIAAQASLSSEEFADVLPLLGKKYWAIAMDVLGCGNSDQPPFKPQVEDYVRNIIHSLML